MPNPAPLKSGKSAETFSLVESYHVHGSSRQRTLLNLGQDFAIPKEQWRKLMRMVADHLLGIPPLPFEDNTLKQASQEIVQRLQANGYDLHDPRDDRDAILTNEMEHTDTRTVGGERVALHALQLLKFSKILHALHFNRNQIHWATALVVGRMLSPGSERQTYEWMMERSSILDLLDAKIPSTQSLYDVGDLLYTHREAIMEGLFGNTKALLGFDETIMFYDLTNTFYMGRQQGELLQFGHRKEKRSHCPLVTFALVLDGSGFPRTAKILPGNASEPKTLKQAIAQWKGDQPTVIMDAGTLSEANLADLKEQGLGWICVERSKTPPVPERSSNETFQTTTKTQIRAWSLGVKEEELRVYLHSEPKQAASDQILETKRRAFEAEIAYLKEGLSIQGRPKRSALIEKKIGRLTEKYKKVANPYEVRVIKNKKGTTATSIQMQKRSAFDEGTDASGGYVIRTSHTDWDCKTVAQTYWRLGEMEQTFRTMKSDLGLRPIYHRKTLRMEAHLFLCILAFHTAHLIRSKLRAHQIYSSWGTIKVRLNHQSRVTTILPQNKTHGILLKQDARLKPFAQNVFKAMGLRMGRNVQKIKAKRLLEKDEEM